MNKYQLPKLISPFEEMVRYISLNAFGISENTHHERVLLAVSVFRDNEKCIEPCVRTAYLPSINFDK